MSRYSSVIAFAAAAAGLLAWSPQPAAQSALRKQRMHDVPTPAVLQPLRTEPTTLPSFEPSPLPAGPDELWDLDAATGAHYRRGELLVRFKDGVSTTLRAQTLQRNGVARKARTLPANWELVALDSARVGVMEATAGLIRSGAVDQVSLNYRVSKQQARPNDAEYRLQWNFDAINMPAAWQINPGGQNDVIVAVIDTGLNTVSETFVFSSPFVGQIAVRFAAVPDLVADGRIQGAYDFVYDDDAPVDLDGHGTHVAGTIAQQTNNNIGVAGVAYNVKLMPLKVLSGGWDFILAGNQGGSVALIAEAIRYAADNGAKVINLSLGGTGPAPIARDAIQYAVGKGAFVAIAAGNDGDAGNPVEYPASYAGDIAGVMAVGAVNRSLGRAFYSGFQPYVEICAPGGEVDSDVDYEHGVTQVSYEELSTLSSLSLPGMFTVLQLGFRPRFDRFELRPFMGTSMASPHVAGVAALLYSQGIRNPAAIEQAIKRFAAPIDATEDECGAGLVDARRALRGLGLGR